jgi:hypothetical protein
MTMSPEHVDLHRMVDRFDPDQVRALRAVAQQLLRPGVRHSGPGEATASEPLLAGESVRDFSFIGLFVGAPDLYERSVSSWRTSYRTRCSSCLRCCSARRSVLSGFVTALLSIPGAAALQVVVREIWRITTSDAELL